MVTSIHVRKWKTNSRTKGDSSYLSTKVEHHNAAMSHLWRSVLVYWRAFRERISIRTKRTHTIWRDGLSICNGDFAKMRVHDIYQCRYDGTSQFSATSFRPTKGGARCFPRVVLRPISPLPLHKGHTLQPSMWGEL